MKPDRTDETLIVPNTILVDSLMHRRGFAGRLKPSHFVQSLRVDRRGDRQRFYVRTGGNRSMRIRDALESDAETLAAEIDRPRGVVINMIHDRSVRVAISEGHEEPGAEADHADGDDDGSTVAGFVAFDVRRETVHVTDFDGDEATVRRLFEEPQRFASREGMGVEVVVPDDEPTSTLVDVVGFEPVGRGPQFEGRETTRYRIEADDLNVGS